MDYIPLSPYLPITFTIQSAKIQVGLIMQQITRFVRAEITPIATLGTWYMSPSTYGRKRRKELITAPPGEHHCLYARHRQAEQQ